MSISDNATGKDGQAAVRVRRKVLVDGIEEIIAKRHTGTRVRAGRGDEQGQCYQRQKQ
jgi:hypothetical protein